ncbi:(Fe-S)-binding protein [Dermatophilus congolensis]|uniref:(Fe-S)-binding protein n=1 Tax=Dermatophilus congolensis TaxID=1863 RepID=UPI001AB05CD6|nr:(Fe-S)-binding protein [Dermatophilus congolensis]MBO3179737.1 (Fe-S)-binding protein [Dermatophilus congolensis]MBO3185099.1 (Fe-S)-binding protein [Dermatophilus congolensis]
MTTAAPSSPAGTRPGEGLTVALFATCANDAMFPNTPKAVTTLLERLGVKVTFPQKQTCCGQAFTNSGYFDETIPLVRNFVNTFSDYDYIVAPSGSCVGSVRDQHTMLAEHAGDSGLRREAADIASRTYDISEFLIDVLGTVDVGAYFPHKVTYHPTCHSVRMAKVGDRPMRLLQAVSGITVLELEDADRCCGFGGTFSMKNPDVSVAMAADKARHVADTGAEYLVAGDNLCLLNISGVLGRNNAGIRPVHLAEILASIEEAQFTPGSSRASREGVRK